MTKPFLTLRSSALLLGLAAAAAVAAPATASASTGASPVVGHVYVNDNTAGTNTIGAFDRHADGTLIPEPGSPFPAGGAGTGSGLASQGAIQFSADGRFVIAVDAGSNQISVLQVHRDGKLSLVGTEVGTSKIDSFTVRFDGRLTAAPGSPLPAQGLGPFGSEFRYQIADDGTLTLLGSTPVAATGGVGAVDARLSPDGRYLYVDESKIGAVGAFAVTGGTLTELPGSPIKLPAGATPAGIVVS
jgi:6-phosphogluconolactonase